jgi:hypothetical protein
MIKYCAERDLALFCFFNELLDSDFMRGGALVFPRVGVWVRSGKSGPSPPYPPLTPKRTARLNPTPPPLSPPPPLGTMESCCNMVVQARCGRTSDCRGIDWLLYVVSGFCKNAGTRLLVLPKLLLGAIQGLMSTCTPRSGAVRE